MMIRNIGLLPFCLVFVFVISALEQHVHCQQDDLEKLQTVAESSNYQATARHEEVVAFIDTCVFSSIHVSRLDFGLSVEGRPMVSALVANPPFDIDKPDERLRILLLGNIHSGECAGKEALLEILRDLSKDSVHPWLEDCVFIIAPNYNVDANERVGVNQRPGQVGPVQGMGQRANPQQLDLNRDFVKLESPEARSLVSLVDQFDPHMFIDCHTTNGSRHRYVLTYDIPHNPSSPQILRDFMRNNMMPSITESLAARDIHTFYYGNFRSSNDGMTWVTYGDQPRYSTEYIGMRGRLGILSEAYSYATYQERIDGTKAFVSQCVEFVKENRADVVSLLDDIRNGQIEVAATRPNHVLMHLDSRMVAFDDKVSIRGFDGQEPKDIECTFFGKYEPVISVEMPFCYLIPKEFSRSVGRLLMHGIQVEQLKTDTDLQVELNSIQNISKARAYQGHEAVTLETETRIETRKIPAGTFLVRTNQPLGRLASYMLEPESNDGLVTWNFLDRRIHVGADFPILQIRQPVEMESNSVNELPAHSRLDLADIFGPNRVPISHSIGDVQWIDNSSYSIEKNGRKVQVDALSGGESRLAIPWDTNAARETIGSIEGLSPQSIRALMSSNTQIVSNDQTMFVLDDGNNKVLYNRQRNKADLLDENTELIRVSPSGKSVALVSNNNLFVVNESNDLPVTVTTDGGEQVLNGKLDWVYQEELYGRGNFFGHWWSPNSAAIAFLRLDEEPVYRYTVSDHIPFRGADEITPYPKAGDPLPKVSVGIYSTSEQRLVWADLSEYGEQDILVSGVGWTKGGERAVIQVQDREQLWLDLCFVDPLNGSVNKLFRDQTPAWIESPGDPIWLNDGGFLWLSPRGGFRRVCKYDSEGQLVGQFPEEDFELRSLLGVSQDEKIAYVTGCPNSPVSVQVIGLNLDGSGHQVLTDGSGTHDADFNDDFTMFLDIHSTATMPTRKTLRRASDGTQIRIVDPNIGDFMEYLDTSPPEFLTVPTPEGGELQAMMIKPVDFDPNKKYPVVVHVYAGPQAPRVRDRFMGDNYLWHQYLAQNGYVVWMCDNRAASYAGLKYTWPIHGDLGRNELADIQLGLEFLKTNEWVDASRIGIWGWSYGGYMTAYAMTHSSDFKAGISGAPVTDWRNYDAIYTERLMGTPQNNPTGYEASSVLSAAKDLSGRLLLIHGTIDDNVHISNSMQLVYELQKHGKQFDFMVYPKNRHSVRDPEQRLHLYQLMTDFIFKNL